VIGDAGLVEPIGVNQQLSLLRQYAVEVVA
jgi:hypothetical protein